MQTMRQSSCELTAFLVLLNRYSGSSMDIDESESPSRLLFEVKYAGIVDQICKQASTRPATLASFSDGDVRRSAELLKRLDPNFDEFAFHADLRRLREQGSLEADNQLLRSPSSVLGSQIPPTPVRDGDDDQLELVYERSPTRDDRDLDGGTQIPRTPRDAAAAASGEGKRRSRKRKQDENAPALLTAERARGGKRNGRGSAVTPRVDAAASRCSRRICASSQTSHASQVCKRAEPQPRSRACRSRHCG